MKEIEPGDKVKYHTGDKRWKTGKIHGVRKVDIAGRPEVLSYLVDTGGHERLDVYGHSLKNEAFQAEYKRHLKSGKSYTESHARATEAVKKMPDELVENIERQPEQIDIRPENIKPA